MIIGGNKEKVIDNIKTAVENEDYNVKVEEGDPVLSTEESKNVVDHYVKRMGKFTHKINNLIAKQIIRITTFNVNRHTKIEGLENIEGIDSGAIITSNHFNPLDNIIIRKFARKAGKKKLYIVSQDTNLAMRGLFGFLMNHANLIPICNHVSYMKRDFQKIMKKTLDKKNLVLIYPEQEMWFNYKKPRPTKPGAYYYASKYNVPVISCFVEIIERNKKDTDEFKKVKYVLHVLKPIYPDKDKTDKENAAWMKERDYAQKKEAYEKVYNKKLDYKFEKDDIAGWIPEEEKEGEGK